MGKIARLYSEKQIEHKLTNAVYDLKKKYETEGLIITNYSTALSTPEAYTGWVSLTFKNEGSSFSIFVKYIYETRLFTIAAEKKKWGSGYTLDNAVTLIDRTLKHYRDQYDKKERR